MNESEEQSVSSRALDVPGVGIVLRDVSKAFAVGGKGNATVATVANVSLDIEPGSFTALLGPSGCGKTTVLRLIAGLETPTGGTLERSEPRRIGRTAYVFQDAHLLPWRNVLDNASLALELAGVEKSERRQRAAEVLKRVGLAGFEKHYPAQLSGGMRMRVSVARALVTQPGLLLMDEPFAALDEITRQQLDELLRELWQSTGMTVLFVTHSVAEAVYLATRAVVFSARPARVVLNEQIELPVHRPAAIRTTSGFAMISQKLFLALHPGSQDSTGSLAMGGRA